MAPREGLAPIYNATYTLFRLSPLYVRDATNFWSEDNLNFHSRRFADNLQTDNLRTVNTVVDETDDTISKAGPFKQCRWSMLRQPTEDNVDATSADDLGLVDGLQVDVEYEKASYTALLLRPSGSGKDETGDVIKLPLVAIRMPAALRSSFTYYLMTIFDTRTEPLQLSSTAICRSLENFLNECADNEESFEKTVKEIQLTLTFNKPIQPSLKSLDIAIRRDDVQGFLKQGQAINATKVTRVKSVEGSFMIALHKYLQAHIALDINKQQVVVSRVACGAFALGREGKAKLFPPSAGTDDNGDYDAAAMASRRATAQVLQVILQAAIGNS